MTRLPVRPLLPMLVLITACTRSASGPTPPVPATPVDQSPVTAQQSNLGILAMTVDVRDDGILLHVGGLPQGSNLECDLDGKPLIPCDDGALFSRPLAGNHKITGVALNNAVITALGETKAFAVAAGALQAIDPTAASGAALALASTDQTFTNGMTVPLSKDLVLHFQLASQPPCAKPTISCKYDSRTSNFWTACDTGDQSFTVGRNLLATGLQYLSVQASCGDQMGPELQLSWYGVPDGYLPLMLRDIADDNGRHIVNLVKADDCPESQQQFQCAAPGTTTFAACANGNVLDQPADGTQIEIVCGDRTGPALVLGAASATATGTSAPAGTSTSTN